MNIINKTNKKFSRGDLQAIVALGVLEAHSQGWLVFGNDEVLVGHQASKGVYVLQFGSASDTDTIPVYLSEAAVKAQFERVKEAKVREYCEKISRHVEEAMLSVNEEARNIETMDVPKSLEYFVEQLAGDLRAQADHIEQLLEELESVEQELTDDQ